MRRLLLGLAALYLLLVPAAFVEIPSWVGRSYCVARHPLEAITSDRKTTCESQHIQQRQSGGGNVHNTVWINTLEHDYLDRSADKPWQNARAWLDWGNANLERAYMLGSYANGFHFAVFTHRGHGKLTWKPWDAISQLVHGVASVLHFVPKEIDYISYQKDRYERGRSTQLSDAGLGVLIDLAEVGVGIPYTIVGVALGLLFQPLTSLMNLPGGVLLLLETIVMALVRLVGLLF